MYAWQSHVNWYRWVCLLTLKKLTRRSREEVGAAWKGILLSILPITCLMHFNFNLRRRLVYICWLHTSLSGSNCLLQKWVQHSNFESNNYKGNFTHPSKLWKMFPPKPNVILLLVLPFRPKRSNNFFQKAKILLCAGCACWKKKRKADPTRLIWGYAPPNQGCRNPGWYWDISPNNSEFFAV